MRSGPVLASFHSSGWHELVELRTNPVDIDWPVNSGPSSTKFGSNSAALGPNSTKFEPTLTSLGPNPSTFGPISAQFGALSTSHGASSVACGANPTKFGRFRQTRGPASSGVELDQFEPAFGQASADFGVWAELDQTWAGIDHEFGSNSITFRPNSTTRGPGFETTRGPTSNTFGGQLHVAGLDQLRPSSCESALARRPADRTCACTRRPPRPSRDGVRRFGPPRLLT